MIQINKVKNLAKICNYRAANVIFSILNNTCGLTTRFYLNNLKVKELYIGHDCAARKYERCKVKNLDGDSGVIFPPRVMFTDADGKDSYLARSVKVKTLGL